ncbi:capsular biosynthesis protein [Rhizobium deserti]|uniref:Capsular biosynthesis protein n=2 Tax=Rhizobium deserti TaxID=2547961 RepID=A0A4R5UPA0_9HYPH|nr:capsular biosynthesis protein [Rhizobium deserti]
MRAVVLRDVRTRFFDHGLGFLIVPLWPLAHMLILLAMYHFSGRAVPYGESATVFFATGLVPTLCFLYVSRFMQYSVLSNRPMMSFPVVKLLDVLFARAYLEVIGAFATAALMVLILKLIGDDPWPYDLADAVSAYLATLLVAIGTGTLFGVLAAVTPLVVTAYALFSIVIYISSGTLFVAASLPSEIGYALSLNPVFQCVEWMRVAYYPTYSDKLLDREYTVFFGLMCLFAGMMLERLIRRRLLEG